MPIKPSMKEKLHEARDQLKDAEAHRAEVIVEAWRAGGGMREIGDEVGMSHNGVALLLERLGVRRRWRNLEDAVRELEKRDRLHRRNR